MKTTLQENREIRILNQQNMLNFLWNKIIERALITMMPVKSVLVWPGDYSTASYCVFEFAISY